MRQRPRHRKPARFLVLVLILSLASLGFGYASWTQTLVVDGSVETAVMSVKWLNQAETSIGTAISCDDNDGDPGLAQVAASRDPGDNQRMDFSVLNAYPGYEATCALRWENDGEIPIKSSTVSIEGQDASGSSGLEFDLDSNPGNDLLIRYSNGGGAVKGPTDGSADQLTIRVLDTATPGTTLEFEGLHLFTQGVP